MWDTDLVIQTWMIKYCRKTKAWPRFSPQHFISRRRQRHYLLLLRIVINLNCLTFEPYDWPLNLVTDIFLTFEPCDQPYLFDLWTLWMTVPVWPLNLVNYLTCLTFEPYEWPYLFDLWTLQVTLPVWPLNFVSDFEVVVQLNWVHSPVLEHLSIQCHILYDTLVMANVQLLTQWTELIITYL